MQVRTALIHQAADARLKLTHVFGQLLTDIAA
jgi:hypothetical protein